jgi:AcrR family transcriptional regulator
MSYHEDFNLHAEAFMDEDLILHETRPTRSDALRNRELLLETAQRLFDEHGVDFVSMSAVAETAGVGKGTLYRHFPQGKTQLCAELIDADQRDLQERTLRRLREKPGEPLDNLRWFLGEVVAFVQRHRQLLFSTVIGGTATMLDHPAHGWWRQTIRGLLQQIRPDMNIEYAADVLYVMLDPRTIHYQQSTHGHDSEYVIVGLTDTLDHFIA